MTPDQRREKLIEMIADRWRRREPATYDELARELNVSRGTIFIDVKILLLQGRVVHRPGRHRSLAPAGQDPDGEVHVA